MVQKCSKYKYCGEYAFLTTFFDLLSRSRSFYLAFAHSFFFILDFFPFRTQAIKHIEAKITVRPIMVRRCDQKSNICTVIDGLLLKSETVKNSSNIDGSTVLLLLLPTVSSMALCVRFQSVRSPFMAMGW